MTFNGDMTPSARSDWRAERLSVDCDTAPLSLIIDPSTNTRFGSLELAFDYQIANFSESEIKQLYQRLLTVSEAVIADPDCQIRNIPIMDAEEYNQVRYCFNNTQADFAYELTYHDLWKEQVGKYPDKPAIVYKNRSLTFSQADGLALDLSNLLRACGVGTDQLVGILSERSLELLPAALGVIAAGAAYLPIDPNYPDDRIQYMLSDSQAQVLFCQRRLLDKIGSYSGVVIFMDDFAWVQTATVDSEEFSKSLSDNTVNFPKTPIVAGKNWQKPAPADLIYMIYTSGSTAIW